MQSIAREMHRMTGDALTITKGAMGDPAILDMCSAPGGFLSTAMDINPGAHALGISLPASDGGHKVRMPEDPNVSYKFLDINMLASDMGVSNISPEHPDFENFLPQQFDPNEMFDLVLCDGQVLRTQNRAAYREPREASRLTAAQLAIGLEHLSPGGTIVILLHGVETPKWVRLLYTFDKFSSVQLFKPAKHHAKRSSFYMIARDVQSQHPEALSAVAAWKTQWKAATFGTDEEFQEVLRAEYFDVEKVLQDFGSELLRMGREVWAIQAQALSKAPWMKNQNKKQETGDRTTLE
jgi:23S rRNA U2552 (ribose-2'-O)-methylase RlmE/FtsJ